MAYVAEVSTSHTDDRSSTDDESSTDERARSCVREVRARLATVATELRSAASIELAPRAPASTVVTGIGGSEGPARLFAAAANTPTSTARFVPLSSFVSARPRAERLVVLSQGLSPNARLALRRSDEFAETIVVGAVDPDLASSSTASSSTTSSSTTSSSTDPSSSASSSAASSSSASDLERRELARALRDRGVVLVTHGPAVESGMLVRLVGPTVASSVALRLAAALGGTPFDAERAASAYAAARSTVDPLALDAPLVLAAAGALTESLFGLRWKWLETFGADPHVFDVLACAHGPLQALYERPATWLVFESPASEPLVERLARVLPPRHTLRRLRVSDDPALAFFEATALLDAHLLATLAARPRDLRRWPGRGADGPLYDLGS